MAVSNIITSQMLSNSSALGIGILVATDTSTGTTIHATGGNDEVWLWAVHKSGGGTLAALTIEFGGTDPVDNFKYLIPDKEGLISIMPGWMLTSGTITAFTPAGANAVSIFGYVNRIGTL